MNLLDWSRRWQIPETAMNELRAVLASDDPPAPTGPRDEMSEAGVQARVRLAASKRGWRVWRNNVGAFHDDARGIHVRFGLANDSPAMNKAVKSGDLIGIAPRIVQPQDVGQLIGQFVSLEVKHGGWKYRGNEHEKAQLAWINVVRQNGGMADFVSDPTAF